MLYEDPDLDIIITDASKDHGGGGFIVYTIRTGVSFTGVGQGGASKIDHFCRKSKCEGDIQSSAPCAQLLSTYIPH